MRIPVDKRFKLEHGLHTGVSEHVDVISLTHKVIPTHVHIVVIRIKKDLRHDFEILLMTWSTRATGALASTPGYTIVIHPR